MTTRNIIALILLIASLICLYPGLTQPILGIKVGIENVPILGNISLYDVTQSIVDTIRNLFKEDNALVAFLILLFSIVVPILKATLLLVALFAKNLKYRQLLHRFVALIGKWSMADVFVVGILIAFLGTRSNPNINAQLYVGFYYFLAYCILSILAYQFMKLEEGTDVL